VATWDLSVDFHRVDADELVHVRIDDLAEGREVRAGEYVVNGWTTTPIRPSPRSSPSMSTASSWCECSRVTQISIARFWEAKRHRGVVEPNASRWVMS